METLLLFLSLSLSLFPLSPFCPVLPPFPSCFPSPAAMSPLLKSCRTRRASPTSPPCPARRPAWLIPCSRNCPAPADAGSKAPVPCSNRARCPFFVSRSGQVGAHPASPLSPAFTSLLWAPFSSSGGTKRGRGADGSAPCAPRSPPSGPRAVLRGFCRQRSVALGVLLLFFLQPPLKNQCSAPCGEPGAIWGRLAVLLGARISVEGRAPRHRTDLAPLYQALLVLQAGLSTCLSPGQGSPLLIAPLSSLCPQLRGELCPQGGAGGPQRGAHSS